MKTLNKKIIFLAAFIALSFAFAGTAFAQVQTLYTFARDKGTEPEDFYLAKIDPATAEISIINQYEPLVKEEKVAGLDFSPCAGIDGNVYGANKAELREYDIVTGELNVALSLTGDLKSATAFAFHPDGRLFATNNGLDALYEVDLSTGGSTLIGPVGFDMKTSGMDFAPDGTLYLIEGGKGEPKGTHSLYTVDIETGAATLVGPVGYEFGSTDIAITDGGTFYVSAGGVEAPDGTTYGKTLLTVDPGTGTGTIIGKLKHPTNSDIKAEVAALGWGPVEDTVPPTINSVSASPDVLWPPNHKMVDVTVTVDCEDICNPEPDCWIVGVTSNELINGPGDGNTEPDWELFDDEPLVVLLRAERAGGGTGRIYTIHIECMDASGNIAEAIVDVIVPHDQGKGNR